MYLIDCHFYKKHLIEYIKYKIDSVSFITQHINNRIDWIKYIKQIYISIIKSINILLIFIFIKLSTYPLL